MDAAYNGMHAAKDIRINAGHGGAIVARGYSSRQWRELTTCPSIVLMQSMQQLKALDQYEISSETAHNSFLDAHLVPDEVTPYRRQYYLLHDA